MRFEKLLAVALCTTVAAACGDDPAQLSSTQIQPDAGEPDRGRPIPDVSAEEEPVVECLPALDAVDGASLTVVAGEAVDLAARLHDCDDLPIIDETVEFAIEGDAAGAQLVSRTAFTDDNGKATVALRAGAAPGQVEVVATAADVEPLVFTVVIEGATDGDIEVTIGSPGEIAFDAFDTLLFAAATCAELGPYDRGDAYMTAPTVATTESQPLFSDVPIGTGYAVVVLADYDGGLLGYGCADEVEVFPAQTTPVTVVVGEIPVLYHGVYDLSNRFDFSNALPPSVASTLQILGELSDDDDLEGNEETEDYGLDPAAFILDFVYREFCCWEATGSDPDFDSCRDQAFQHPVGDLSALYLEDFTSWDGAQPMFFGACGGLEFDVNELLQESLQNFIVAAVPDVVLNLLDMVSDLSRAITDARIGSELTVSDASLTKTGNFTHELLTMTVELHDLDGALHTFVFPLADAGLTNLAYSDETSVAEGHRLVIPDHSFRVDFGRLLHYIYAHGLLPLLDCDADRDGATEPCESTGELLASWVDCELVGAWLYENIGFFPEAGYVALCDAGVAVAGLVVDDQFVAATASETIISLQGECGAGALDERRRATELVEGVWDGVLVEDGLEVGPFDGTFTGVRTGDPE